MKITRAILTVALAAGLTVGVAGAGFAQQGATPNYGNNPPPNQPKAKNKRNLPPGVKCQPGYYGLADCNVSRNGRTFGPEGYDYAIGTGQHIGR